MRNFFRRLTEHIRNHKKPYGIILIIVVAYLILVPRCKFREPFSTVITDRNDLLLGARVATDGQWRFPQPDSVPYRIRKATIAFEDRYFYLHPGINPVSIIRALRDNIRARSVVSGGSTLTMQTIRIFRKGRPRTIFEKMIEMIMATRLELEKSKSDILRIYTSYAPYGGNVVGIEAAAWRYFGTSTDGLTWAQAATLAVLPNSPSMIHPGKNRVQLLKKRNRLLKRLLNLGWIDKVTYEVSLAEQIPEKPVPMPSLAPHLLNRIWLSEPQTNTKTTIDAVIQHQVYEIAETQHQQLKLNEIHNVAVIVMEVESGSILAYIGNCGYPIEKKHSNDVDVVISPRSTGSLLKPLLFAGMIDDGKILPSSLVADIPINLSGFSPQNFDGQFQGAVPASKALSRSLNVPAVEMLRQYGIDRFQHLLRTLGMSTLKRPADDYGLSLILGGAEGTLEEMSNIYASLSRVLNHYGDSGKYYSGDYRAAQFKTANLHPEQSVISQPEIFYASSIWSSYQAMVQVNRPEEETGWQNFSSSRKIAWKTGTSFGYRDGWAIGTSGKYVVGVWIGNADGEGRPGLTGIATAAPVMFEIFNILPDVPWFQKPVDELVNATVCRQSGYIAGPNCPATDTVKIPLTGVRSPVCPFHKLIHLSADLRYRVNSDCYPVESMKHIEWFILPPVQEWYYRRYHADYKRLPPYMPGCIIAGQKSMDLIYPRDELKIYIPRSLEGNKSRVVFEAVHSNPDALIFWHLDDHFVTTTKQIHQVELLPAKGPHKITLVDENGEELVRKFIVLEP